MLLPFPSLFILLFSQSRGGEKEQRAVVYVVGLTVTTYKEVKEACSQLNADFLLVKDTKLPFSKILNRGLGDYQDSLFY